MDSVELPRLPVNIVVSRRTREVFLPFILTTGDLPRKQAISDADDLVALGTVAITACERKHRVVLAFGLVSERQAVVQCIGDIVVFCGFIEAETGCSVVRLAEESCVATGYVAGAHDVAHDAHVLGFGDDRLGVTPVDLGKGGGANREVVRFFSVYPLSDVYHGPSCIQ